MIKKPLTLWDSVRRADRIMARRRVERLRSAFPQSSRDQLCKLLVRNKCIQAGTVGALTAITGAIPGVGRLASFALGPLADTALLSALQAELVIEVFALYDMEIPEHGENIAILAIAATNLGTDEIAREASRWLAQRASGLLGARWLRGAWPLANVATAAATNIAVTYAIGSRTQTLCKIHDATIHDWPDLFRRVAMIDQSTMMNWAGKAARSAIEQASDGARLWSQRIGAYMPNLDFLGQVTDEPKPPARIRSTRPSSVKPKAKPATPAPVRARKPAAAKRNKETPSRPARKSAPS
jgi:uncharacterized protein (DUF697 family)